MGFFFTSGEVKKRPGIYQRYENVGAPVVAGANGGTVAAVIRSSWGPLGKVVACESYDAALAAFGSGGTVQLLEEAFAGGASMVRAVRLGSEGARGSVVLKDGGEAPQDTVKVTAKYSGDRAFRYLIREALGDAGVKEFAVYENGRLLEKLPFAADGEKEPENLVKAGAASRYFVFEAIGGAAEGTVGLAAETDFPRGSAPAITNADYSAAFALLEAHPFNALIVDTAETAVQQLAANFVRRVCEYGKFCFAVLGEPVSVDFDTRCAHARAYNDYRVIYVGGGFENALGERVDGTRAAARVAGMAAAIPSSESLTHTGVAGAADTAEKLTGAQYAQSIDSGMLTFSLSSKGTVWVESGITTLVSPSGQDDEGWKKIKRVKVRWELMERVSATTEPLVGHVNNNPDGQATVLQAIQKALDTMAAEEKILSGASVSLDPANPPAGDSAWFVLQADDVDTLEKLYFVYQFRYCATA